MDSFPTTKSSYAKWILWTSLCVVFILAARLGYHNFPYSDGAEHGAVLQALASNLTNPGDPMLDNEVGQSPRYVPSALIIALVMKLLGADFFSIAPYISLGGFVLFMIAVALFVRSYFDNNGLVIWAQIAVLFLWGKGWSGANGYMFTALLNGAYFPSLIAFCFALLGLWCQLEFLRTHRISWYFGAALLAGLSFVNHPPTGIFNLVCAGLLILEGRASLARGFLGWVGMVVTVLVMLTVWPYYDFWHSLSKIASGEMGRSADYQLTRAYLYSAPLLRIGPALVGGICIVYYMLRRRFFLLVVACTAFSLLYAAGYIFHISLAERYVFFIVFFMQLGFAAMYRETFNQRGQLLRWIMGTCLAVGIIWQTTLLYSEYLRPAFTPTPNFPFVSYRQPDAIQRSLAQYLGPGDVVLSEIFSSWSIPVYTGARIVAMYHASPHVLDNQLRIDEIEQFYKATTDNARRQAIITKYGVTHVLINYHITGRYLEPSLKQLGCKVLIRNEDYVIFQTSTDS